MTEHIVRTIRCAAAATVLLLAAGLFAAASADAQVVLAIRVMHSAVVMDAPRADGFVIGRVEPGDQLQVLEQRGSWYLVVTPDRVSRRRGWIQVRAAEVVDARPLPRPPTRDMLIRGFAQTGGTLLTAKNSFDTILGRSSEIMYGFGGQVVFPVGVYVEGSAEEFRKTGTRVLVSGSEIFTLPIENTITVLPFHATLGYREAKYRRWAPYVGVGLSWQTLREEAPLLGESRRRSHLGYHVVGGAEMSIWSWISIAGEVQRTVVPKLLGTSGVSAVFGEDDAGATTFRMKLIVGR
jgi:hypothetical protein